MCLVFIVLVLSPDCVYIHFPLSQSSCLSVLHHIFDFKIITCFHGHDVLRYEEGYSKESVQYRAQRGLVRQSDQVTACSGYLARCVERTFGCTNVCVVYNGVDLTRFDNFKPCPVTLENTPYLFAWGRLEQIKGFDLLIQAFARSKSSHELKLLIAGEGSERENLQQLIDALELKDKVMLIGRLTPDDIVQYAQNSEINIIPSRRESFGIVALEAIAAKQPIIATNSGGLPEIISDKYGLTVPVDVGEIRKAIDKILTKEISFDYSDTKEYLKHFTIKRMVENYLILQNNHNGC
ncbi:glycosyltransferase family 4 protein [Parabacteroides distasonis]|nr:glycosyltransferase family 4 protein [Parabacteroides distasonis]